MKSFFNYVFITGVGDKPKRRYPLEIFQYFMDLTGVSMISWIGRMVCMHAKLLHHKQTMTNFERKYVWIDTKQYFGHDRKRLVFLWIVYNFLAYQLPTLAHFFRQHWHTHGQAKSMAQF